MEMTRIDYAAAKPLAPEGSANAPGAGPLTLVCGTAVAVLAAPALLLWVMGETLVRDLRRLGRGLAAVGEEVIRAARD